MTSTYCWQFHVPHIKAIFCCWERSKESVWCLEHCFVTQSLCVFSSGAIALSLKSVATTDAVTIAATVTNINNITNLFLLPLCLWRMGMDIQILVYGWRWVVNFRSRPLNPQYPLNRRLDGPLDRYEWRGEAKNLAYRDSELSAVQPVASRSDDCTIPAPIITCITATK